MQIRKLGENPSKISLFFWVEFYTFEPRPPIKPKQWARGEIFIYFKFAKKKTCIVENGRRILFLSCTQNPTTRIILYDLFTFPGDGIGMHE